MITIPVRSNKPTEQAYQELQRAYDWYNNYLFNGELPSCLITFQRAKKTMGYFCPKRFVDQQGNITDEIALNPEFFPIFPPIEIMQTLVHEMCHLWQSHLGNPSRSGYHNAEWARKMEAIGLMPSSTGRAGGAKTGQKMGDYAIPDGLFARVTLKLFSQGFAISWYDRHPPKEPCAVRMNGDNINVGLTEQWREAYTAELEAHHATTAQLEHESDGSGRIEPEGSVYDVFDDAEDLISFAFHAPSQSMGIHLEHKEPDRSNRVKYVCPPCRTAVWGKPRLKIKCIDCDHDFIPTGEI